MAASNKKSIVSSEHYARTENVALLLAGCLSQHHSLSSGHQPFVPGATTVIWPAARRLELSRAYNTAVPFPDSAQRSPNDKVQYGHPFCCFEMGLEPAAERWLKQHPMPMNVLYNLFANRLPPLPQVAYEQEWQHRLFRGLCWIISVEDQSKDPLIPLPPSIYIHGEGGPWYKNQWIQISDQGTLRMMIDGNYIKQINFDGHEFLRIGCDEHHAKYNIRMWAAYYHVEMEAKISKWYGYVDPDETLEDEVQQEPKKAPEVITTPNNKRSREEAFDNSGFDNSFAVQSPFRKKSGVNMGGSLVSASSPDGASSLGDSLHGDNDEMAPPGKKVRVRGPRAPRKSRAKPKNLSNSMARLTVDRGQKNSIEGYVAGQQAANVSDETIEALKSAYEESATLDGVIIHGADNSRGESGGRATLYNGAALVEARMEQGLGHCRGGPFGGPMNQQRGEYRDRMGGHASYNSGAPVGGWMGAGMGDSRGVGESYTPYNGGPVGGYLGEGVVDENQLVNRDGYSIAVGGALPPIFHGPDEWSGPGDTSLPLYPTPYPVSDGMGARLDPALPSYSTPYPVGNHTTGAATQQPIDIRQQPTSLGLVEYGAVVPVGLGDGILPAEGMGAPYVGGGQHDNAGAGPIFDIDRWTQVHYLKNRNSWSDDGTEPVSYPHSSPSQYQDDGLEGQLAFGQEEQVPAAPLFDDKKKENVGKRGRGRPRKN